MQEMEWFGPVELCVPCHKRMMLVVRMTATGVASRFNLTMDAMDDLKMAVEEACQSIMLQDDGFDQLKLRFDVAAEGLKIEVFGQGRKASVSDASCMSLCPQEVLACILESMVDHVEFIQDEKGMCGIRLIKKMTLDA